MNNFSFPDSLFLASVLSWVKSRSPKAYDIFYSLIYPEYSIGCTNPWQEIYTRSALFGNRVRFFDQRLRNLTYFFLLQSYRNHVSALEKKENQVLLLCNITSKSKTIDSESMTAWHPQGSDDSNSVLLTYFCSEKDIHVCLWISYATMGLLRSSLSILKKNILDPKINLYHLLPLSYYAIRLVTIQILSTGSPLPCITFMRIAILMNQILVTFASPSVLSQILVISTGTSSLDSVISSTS